MLSKSFLPMTATVMVAVATYYFFANETMLSENISIAMGVAAAIICSVLFKKLHKDRKRDY